MSLLDDLDPEDLLCELGVDYQKSSGSSGAQLNVIECPACGNRKKKVYLNAETGLGNCFACDMKFNKWKFAAFSTGLEGKELSRRIIEIKESLGFKPVKKKRIITAEVDAGALQLPDSLALPTTDGRNAQYLEDRGVTAEYASYFHLRYCADAWHNYTKDDGSNGGQNCGNRIIIPVYDLNGKLATFQARDITGTAEQKYLFPAKLPGAGRYLYNGHNAYTAGAREVILNEGNFDVAATKRVIDRFPDMKGIVPIGSFGMHLSFNEDPSSHCQVSAFMSLVKRGLKTVTMMWDGEQKAFELALTAGEILWKRLGLEVRMALLPADKDPDEADQIEVYNAWADAKPLNAMNMVRWRIKNPYREQPNH